MSEFAKNLSAYRTNKHYSVSPLDGLMKTKETYDRIVPMQAIEYVISTQLATKVIIREEAIEAQPNILEYTVRKAKRDIIEAVFGEFRANFKELRSHAYKTGDYELLQKLDKFEKEMYDA